MHIRSNSHAHRYMPYICMYLHIGRHTHRGQLGGDTCHLMHRHSPHVPVNITHSHHEAGLPTSGRGSMTAEASHLALSIPGLTPSPGCLLGASQVDIEEHMLQSRLYLGWAGCLPTPATPNPFSQHAGMFSRPLRKGRRNQMASFFCSASPSSANAAAGSATESDPEP